MITSVEIIAIEKAEYLGAYTIRFSFTDGTERIIDFEPFLRAAANEMTTKYLSLKEFCTFEIKHRNISWNDYEMCFPLASLYEGKL
ncbi:MAG: DUF2442 domain-containing protein [Candidatus Kapabacteria bacterium]|jgi:hypothetical protein|nr:DUF2442 domain-containing protein [Candidatus Kapabacteria bacterium]